MHNILTQQKIDMNKYVKLSENYMEIWNKITIVHVEPTTKCNASCPGCPRNNNGYGLKDNFELIDCKIKTNISNLIAKTIITYTFQSDHYQKCYLSLP